MKSDIDIFDECESVVRAYCRNFPAVFHNAEGCRIFDERGRDYIDFFAGAGALNYGHNDDMIRREVIAYIQRGGITHSLDFYTTAKRQFLERFREIVLAPRGLDYKVQFTGPTGTNAVEAALKIARKVTGREQVVAFTNAFHGVSLGALAATANAEKRGVAGLPLQHVVRMPYDGFLGDGCDDAAVIESMYRNVGAGLERPAAVIVEVVQGEGGINVASRAWLHRIAELTKELGALLILDEVQTGCGRLGTFFGFEGMGCEPDVICLSKSLGGMGLPMAVTLIRPEYDAWLPGEHNGTFRGNNLAFVAASAALDYWTQSSDFPVRLLDKSKWMDVEIQDTLALLPKGAAVSRGRGMLRGIQCLPAGLADKISAAAFENGLVVETCGSGSDVLKIMPPLVIDRQTLYDGFQRLRAAIVDLVLPQSLEMVAPLPVSFCTNDNPIVARSN